MICTICGQRKSVESFHRGYKFCKACKADRDRGRPRTPEDAPMTPTNPTPSSHIGKPLVRCTVCGLDKNPWGRSAPLEMASSLCSWDCSGYEAPPRPDWLWPGEECDQCPKEVTR